MWCFILTQKRESLDRVKQYFQKLSLDHPVLNETASIWQIYAVAVVKNFHRSGISTQLMNACIHYANKQAQLERKPLVMWCNASEIDGYHFYKNFGFQGEQQEKFNSPLFSGKWLVPMAAASPSPKLKTTLKHSTPISIFGSCGKTDRDHPVPPLSLKSKMSNSAMK